MSDKETLRRHVIRGGPKPTSFELMLDGIRFLREELGIYSSILPHTHDEAERELAKLTARVNPPTTEQLEYIDDLLTELGGVMSGNIHSCAHASILIEELERCMEETLLEHDREEKRRLQRDLNIAAVIGGLLVGSQI